MKNLLLLSFLVATSIAANASITLTDWFYDYTTGEVKAFFSDSGGGLGTYSLQVSEYSNFSTIAASTLGNSSPLAVTMTLDCNKEYFLRIRKFAIGTPIWSTTESFWSTLIAPSITSVLTTCNSITFNWNFSDNFCIEYELDDDSNFSTPNSSGTTCLIGPKTFSSLSTQEEYYIRIRRKYGSCYSSWVSTGTVTTNIDIDSTYQDGINDDRFTAKWVEYEDCFDTSSSSNYYQVQVRESGDAWYEQNHTTNDKFRTFSSLQQNTTYNWRVRGCSSGNCSPTWEYNTITTSPSVGRISLLSDDLSPSILELSNIEIFPNPAVSHFNFTSGFDSSDNNELLDINYSILDNSGKLIQYGTTSSDIEVDISQLQTGIYFVNFEHSGFGETKRFIKQ